MSIFSFESFIDGGGKFEVPSGTYVIAHSKVEIKEYKKKGADEGTYNTGIRMLLRDYDEKSGKVIEVSEEHPEREWFFSMGSPERIVPTEDGKAVVYTEAMREKIEKAGGDPDVVQLMKTCNFVRFFREAVNAGMPADFLSSPEDDVTKLEGVVVVVVQNDDGTKTVKSKNPDEEDKTEARKITLPVDFLVAPWKGGKAPAKAGAKAAAPAAAKGKATAKAAAPAPAEEASGDDSGDAIDEAVLAAIQGPLADKVKKGGGKCMVAIGRAEVAKQFPEAQKAAVRTMLDDKEQFAALLDAAGLKVSGNNIVLA
jgi:hypothetical protein